MAINKRIRKDGSVGWQVVVSDYDPATGKRVRHTIGTFSPKKRAQKEERKALDALDSGSFIPPSAVTVGDLLDMYVASRKGKTRPNTVSHYKIMIKNYLDPAFATAVAQKVTAQQVQQVVNGWAEAKRYDTARSCLRILSAAFNHAVSMKMVHANPCKAVTAPRNPEPIQRTIWTEAQVRKFLVATEGDDYAALWYLLIETGVRRGEALGLHWRDVDWTASTIRIATTAVDARDNGNRMVLQPMPKTESSNRTIMVSATLLNLLRSHHESNSQHALVFTDQYGDPLHGQAVRNRLAQLAKDAGVPRATVHELRHIAATRMMRAGVPLVVAQQRMGHSSTEMLRKVYQHADADLQRDAVAALERLSALP